MKLGKRALMAGAVVLTLLASGCGSSSSGDGGVGAFGGPNSGDIGRFPSSGGAGPGTGEPVPFAPGTELVSLSFTPSPLHLYRGREQALTVQGVTADGSLVALSGQPGVSLSVTPSSTSLLNVSSGTVLTPLARGEGSLDVTVTTPEGSLSGSVPFEVRRRLFLTHFGDDTLRALDAQTYTEVQSVALGGHPLAMYAHQPTDRLWVGVGNGQGIDVFNMADLDQAPTEIGSPLSSYGYYSALFNPFNNSVLWSHIELAGTAGTLQGYDATSLVELASSPQSAPGIRTLKLEGAGNRVLSVTRDSAGPGLQIRDPNSLAVLDTVVTQQSTFDLPLGLVYDAQNQCAYVGSEEVFMTDVSRIITVDLSGTPAISAITTLPLPRGGSMAMAGDLVFISHFTSSAVSVYRTTTSGTPLAFERTLTVGASPSNLTVDPTLNRLLVSSEGTNSLYAFDLATLEPVAGSPFAVGTGPASVVLEP